MVNTERVTLESLLDPMSDVDAFAGAMDFESAAMDVADAIDTVSIIEQNLTTFEAAKIVKKAKSAKKKVKVTKTKMKAKDAKAKKKGGKVLKITREGDETEVSDTDLDAAPETEVTVTEIAPDAETVAQDEVVGTEGADFVVEYEDASIVTLEADESVQKKGLVAAVKALWEKIINFFKSIIAKIQEWANFDKKYLIKNKAAIAKGLTSDVTIKGRKLTKGAKTLLYEMFKDCSDIVKVIKDSINEAGEFYAKNPGKKANSVEIVGKHVDAYAENHGGDSNWRILGVNLYSEDAMSAIDDAIYANKESTAFNLSDSKWTIADIEHVILDAIPAWKKLYGDYGVLVKLAFVSADSNLGASKKAGNGANRCLSTAFRAYNTIRSQARKVMHAAGKAGGGESAPSDEAK